MYCAFAGITFDVMTTIEMRTTYELSLESLVLASNFIFCTGIQCHKELRVVVGLTSILVFLLQA